MDTNKLAELFSQALGMDCKVLEGGSEMSLYKIEFQSKLSVDEFIKFADDCKKFLYQFGIETGAIVVANPEALNKIFMLQINKLSTEKFSEAVAALTKNIELHLAAKKGKVETVKGFLLAGENVNSRNIVGETLLHVAARMGRDKVIDVLLEQGADVNSINNTNETPLHIVAQTNYVSTLEKILARLEIDLQSKDEQGNTCLHLAARVGNEEIMSKFFNYSEKLKGIINLQNEFGETALRIADKLENVEVAKILIGGQLKEEPKAEKPSFDMLEELSEYWDEQIKKLTDKLTTQDTVEGAMGGAEVSSRTQRVENLIRFFSQATTIQAANNPDADEQQSEAKQDVAHLGK